MPTTCPSCASACQDADRFCEECGGDLRPPATWLSSAAPAGQCGHCGAVAIQPGAYCDECGRRRGASQDRVDVALPGVAAVSDRGHRKHHNEDAVAIGAQVDGTTAILCDGVSSSPRADAAAQAAVDVGMAEMLDALAGGASPRSATEAAFKTAFAAVAQLAVAHSAGDSHYTPPSCTYVSGVVTGDGVLVGWVGDSRAYWIPGSGPPRCLTVDDALTERPGAPLTRWVGADATGVEIQIATVERPGSGSLMLCSDGLSGYLSDPADLEVVAGSPPAAAASQLVQLALNSGGADNIAVAVLSFPLPEAVQ